MATWLCLERSIGKNKCIPGRFYAVEGSCDHAVAGSSSSPCLSWQWQVLHIGKRKASGGEASQALGVISSQQAYLSYVGTLTEFQVKPNIPRKLKYIWAPDKGAAFGEGRGIGRVPRDRGVRMRVQRCVENSEVSLWSFTVTRGAEKIASGYRGSKADAVFEAEQAYDDSLG